MMKMKHLARSGYKAMPWRNGKGTTLEIFVKSAPGSTGSAGTGSSNTANNTPHLHKHTPSGPVHTPTTAPFEWRISCATVAEDGPFSFFPGFQRSIAVLNDSLLIKVKHSTSDDESSPAESEMMERRIDQYSAPFVFSGDAHTTGLLVDGKVVRDFNVFTDRAVCEQIVTREVLAPPCPFSPVAAEAKKNSFGKEESGSSPSELETDIVTKSTSSSNTTHCPHCFITFATPSELLLHSIHHCFPDDPAAVMKLFPLHSRVVDTVSGRRGVVVGPARNAHKTHACVSVRLEVGSRSEQKTIEADVAINRLKIRKVVHLSSAPPHNESLVFCCFRGQVEVATAEEKMVVSAGDSCLISGYTGDVEYSTTVSSMPSATTSDNHVARSENDGGLDVFIVNIKYL